MPQSRPARVVQTLDADTTTFSTLITRLGCNKGVTVDVNDPDIELSDGLSDRALVDGACASSEANGTQPCLPDGARYTR